MTRDEQIERAIELVGTRDVTVGRTASAFGFCLATPFVPFAPFVPFDEGGLGATGGRTKRAAATKVAEPNATA